MCRCLLRLLTNSLVEFLLAGNSQVVINQFTRVANSENCSYFGNVKLDEDITLTALRALYHVVLIA